MSEPSVMPLTFKLRVRFAWMMLRGQMRLSNMRVERSGLTTAWAAWYSKVTGGDPS